MLFPTWHRAYLVKVEEALQSIPDCGDVMLPDWNETSQASRSGAGGRLDRESTIQSNVSVLLQQGRHGSTLGHRQSQG